VVEKTEIDALRVYVAETLCLLKLCFPPAFFDAMEHTLVHLVDELEICGPVGGRWMYPCERYLGTLKSFVRNKAQPEASMAKGYAAEEALGFCTEYLNLQQYMKRHIWEAEEEESMKASVVEGAGRVVNLSEAEVDRAHTYVVMNHGCTEGMRR